MRPHPTLPVVLPSARCFCWHVTLSPSWIPCGSCFGVLPLPFYFLLLSVSSVHLLGGLYGDIPSDVINVYQPPETDICITFKSPLMRRRFTASCSFTLFGCPHQSLSLAGQMQKASSPWLCRNTRVWGVLESLALGEGWG